MEVQAFKDWSATLFLFPEEANIPCTTSSCFPITTLLPNSLFGLDSFLITHTEFKNSIEWICEKIWSSAVMSYFFSKPEIKLAGVLDTPQCS